MRVPRLLTHVFDNESTTVTLGFWLFIVASLKPGVTPELWLWCVVISSILVGGKLVAKSILEAIEIKLGGKPDLKDDEEPLKEVKSDGSPATAPAA